jgi:exonuclease VII small subunit
MVNALSARLALKPKDIRKYEHLSSHMHMCLDNLTKHSNKCAWLKESVKAPRPEAHFEAMRKHIQRLESNKSALEAEILRYKDAYGALPEGDAYLHSWPEDTYEEVLDLEYDEEEDFVESLVAATNNLKVNFNLVQRTLFSGSHDFLKA